MKLLFGKSGKEPEVKRQQEKTVLFVCVENAGRSQIAEAFFRKYAPEGYVAKSAGTMPARELWRVGGIFVMDGKMNAANSSY